MLDERGGILLVTQSPKKKKPSRIPALSGYTWCLSPSTPNLSRLLSRVMRRTFSLLTGSGTLSRESHVTHGGTPPFIEAQYGGIQTRHRHEPGTAPLFLGAHGLSVLVGSICYEKLEPDRMSKRKVRWLGTWVRRRPACETGSQTSELNRQHPMMHEALSAPLSLELSQGTVVYAAFNIHWVSKLRGRRRRLSRVLLCLICHDMNLQAYS